MNSPSADQIAVFLAVVDQGSFASAAKSLKRAQSAVTYAIKRLEEEVGAELFDRTEYRPVLTAAGQALLPNARRIADSVASFVARASRLRQGEEADVSLVVDAIFPMQRVRDALRAFTEVFPTVPTQLYVESYLGTAALLSSETRAIGLLSEESCGQASVPLTIHPTGVVELAPVVAASHPLAALPSPISVDDISDCIRLVLGNRPAQGTSLHANFYGALWYVSDVAAKRDLLLSGVGWGVMPVHMIEEDVAAGRLVRIRPERIDYPAPHDTHGGHFVAMCAAHRTDQVLGPASQWLLEYFTRAD